jgi:hypothetical protein
MERLEARDPHLYLLTNVEYSYIVVCQYMNTTNSIRKTNLMHTDSADPEWPVYIVKGSLLHSFIAQQDPSMWFSLGFDYYRLDPRLLGMLLLLVQ